MLFFRQDFYITKLNLPAKILSDDNFKDYQFTDMDMDMVKSFL